MVYGDDGDEVFIGRDLAHTRGYSEEVAKTIDGEVHRIVEQCHQKAKELILAHEDVLHKCAELLIEKIDHPEVNREIVFDGKLIVRGTT